VNFKDLAMSNDEELLTEENSSNEKNSKLVENSTLQNFEILGSQNVANDVANPGNKSEIKTKEQAQIQ
jgi:hypothetical protein